MSRSAFRIAGLVSSAAIVILGSVWAFTRGGADFRVFYHAWQLVLAGHGADIYRDSPDRFLYAPGFAWLFAPLGLLPPGLSLGLWCAAKAAAVFWILFRSAKALCSGGRSNSESLVDAIGVCSWGLILLARPVLIDFEYGQVNLFVLAACVWPVFRYFGLGSASQGKPGDFLSWMVLGIAAIGKLFPLPLLLIPFFAAPAPGIATRRWVSLAGATAGVALMLLAPALTQGWDGLVSLYPQWSAALVSRGLPLESHNQSFVAVLHHFLSGEPTEIIAQHRRQMLLGRALLSLEQIQFIAAAWGAAFMGMILSLILNPRASFRRLALMIAFLVLPSHLVWKPYFSFGLPMAVAAVYIAAKKNSPARWAWLFAVFALMNLSGFDFLGKDFGAVMESAGLMLWAYLLLTVPFKC
ncbi:MAG: glycosyltransferase 87 family protein [Oligoflexia bacterium]|nr:glycosyltransferase 87 family protein [Oligoflexia bacterium]